MADVAKTSVNRLPDTDPGPLLPLLFPEQPSSLYRSISWSVVQPVQNFPSTVKTPLKPSANKAQLGRARRTTLKQGPRAPESAPPPLPARSCFFTPIKVAVNPLCGPRPGHLSTQTVPFHRIGMRRATQGQRWGNQRKAFQKK